MKDNDKLKSLFPNPQDVFKIFHIDTETGFIYKKQFWDKGIKKRTGRSSSDRNYTRVSVWCPHLTHISKRGCVDVLAHRLIYYAFTGKLPEKVDHIRKGIKYPDALSNLRESDSFHNRLNTKKVIRKRLPKEERVDNTPSSFRQRVLKNFRGIYYAYKYYWALYDGKIINSNGFISPILAINCRNNFIKELFLKRYNSLDNFPENSIDVIDEGELFLEQMTQETIEKTYEYKQRQQEIKIEMKKRSQENSKRKLSKSVVLEADPFECIGKYE